MRTFSSAPYLVFGCAVSLKTTKTACCSLLQIFALPTPRKYIPSVAAQRGIDAAPGIAILDQLSRIVEVVDRSLYEEYESSARERMLSRDVDDWPIVAASLLLKCPVWTEDQDFFGSGVSTWTTKTVELYLRDN